MLADADTNHARLHLTVALDDVAVLDITLDSTNFMKMDALNKPHAGRTCDASSMTCSRRMLRRWRTKH